MQVEETSTYDTHTKASVLDNGKLIFRVQYNKTPDRAEMAIYWDGRTDVKGMSSFFEKICSPEPKSFSALTFQPTSKAEIEGIDSVQELVKKFPEDTRFVRFEHASNLRSNATGISARIDLENIPRGQENAPEMIAVAASVKHLKEVMPQVARYITQTANRRMTQKAVREGIHTAIRHFAPQAG